MACTERGYKVRIATMSPGALVALSHHARHYLLNALRKCTPSHSVLEGDVDRSIRVLTETIHDFDKRVVISADLTSASDKIPQWLALEVWKYLGREWNFPPWLVDVTKLCCGP